MTPECRLAARVFGFEDDALAPTAEVVDRATAHLALCAACADRYSADARLAAGLGVIPDAEPPPAFAAPPERRFRRVPLLAAAAVVLVAAAGAALRARRPPAPPLERTPALALPAGTTFTLTTSTITLDRGRRTAVEETTRYAPAASSKESLR